MADQIRVGIIGAGANTTSRHIPGLQAIEGVRIESVCNRSRASSEAVAAKFGIPRIHEKWTDAIADPGLDAIVIGTWPYLHCPATVAALEAGKHVLCEARMAMNAAEAHTMYDTARRRPHLTAQIVPAPMTLPFDRTVQRLIAEGYVGQVLAVEIRSGSAFLDAESPLHWRQDADLSGVNIMSLGIWYESMMRWVGEAVRVQASGQLFVKMRRDEGGVMRSVRVPEHVDVVALLASGAQAHLQVSNVTGLRGDDEIWICGSAGTLNIQGKTLRGGRKGESALAVIEIPAHEAGGWRVEEEFVNAIRGLEPVTHTNFRDGVKYMEFTEAVQRSMATGQAVPLPLQF